MSGAEVVPIRAQPQGEGWLTKAEAAAYLRVTVRTVERRQREGLPHRRVGGRCLYRRSELDRWVDMNDMK